VTRKIIFQHLRKTGGTTIRDLMRPFFRADQSLDLTEAAGRDLDIADFAAQAREHDLIHGHVEVLADAPADSFKFSVFREPYARLLSDRRQWMQASTQDITAMPPAHGRTTNKLQSLSFLEILKKLPDYPEIISSFWNYQTAALGAWPLIRQFSGLRNARSYINPNMCLHFDSGPAMLRWLADKSGEIEKRALKSLAALDYVGLTEDLNNSIRDIFDRIGLPPPVDISVINARTAFEDEKDRELKDYAEQLLVLDRTLYEAAKERHAVQGRIARGAPADYIYYVMPARGKLVIEASDPPNGHGWHPAHRRSDGLWSRYTRGGQSHVRFFAPAGSYRVAINLWGAADNSLIAGAHLFANSAPLQTSHNGRAERKLLSGEFIQAQDGHVDLVISSGTPGQERVLEVRQITICKAVPPPALLVSTSSAVWLLDPVSGRARQIDSGRGVYYGISFSETHLYVACRMAPVGGDRETQNNVILCLDADLKVERILSCPSPIRDVHQILYYDGALNVISTYDDAVHRYDAAADKWTVWKPFGETDDAQKNIHHINSIFADRWGLLLLGNQPAGWVARFTHRREPLGRKDFGNGAHNVWRQGGELWTCSSDQGALISESGLRIDMHPRAFTRGVCRIGDCLYAGASQNRTRDVRQGSDSSVLQLDPDGRALRCYSFLGFGMVHEIRTINLADQTHNNLVFAVSAKALVQPFESYQTFDRLIDLS
jgi:hypothetical protein